MTDRQFSAALEAYHDRLFADAYDVEDEPEPEGWYMVENAPTSYDYTVCAPLRGGSPLEYTVYFQEDAESLVAYLNDTHPNHRQGDPAPDLSAFWGDE